MDFRYFICLLGILLAIPLLGLAAMTFTLPVSFSGVLYLLLGGLAIAGCIVAPKLPTLYPLITLTGLLGLMSIAGARIVRAAPDTDASIQMRALPNGTNPSWVNALIDEQDLLILERRCSI
jgi:hypothetical protein